MKRLVALLIAILGINLAAAEDRRCEPTEFLEALCIKPSLTNPEIKQFDDQHFITYRKSDIGISQPLLVFLPGTTGVPPGPLPFLRTAANHGYRVISLDYNDIPSVTTVCHDREPACSAEMRHMRIYGNTQMGLDIDNSRPEAIVERLYKLLQYLDTHYPDQGWHHYFDRNGMVWSNIALAGQSQGAGMAAFIGKQKIVNRIILFSSPWDFTSAPRRERTLAPWIGRPATTPLDRWFGGYNAHEETADLLARSYALLQIPPEHIRVFNQPLPDNIPPDAKNPYHTQGVGNPFFRPDWIFFLTAPASGS